MPFHLLRIIHQEALESVMDRPDAYIFERTSYCVAPESWRELPASELSRRVKILLDAAYKVRNAWVYQTEDPVPMVLLKYGHEWVNESELAGGPWRNAFHAFRVSDNGQEWHIVKAEEREAVFSERLLKSEDRS